MISPSEKEFLKLCPQGNLIPVYQEVLADMDTPVSAFTKLAEDARYSFLLESVEGEEKVARFSFFAKNPELVIRSKDNQIEFTRFYGQKTVREKKEFTDNPLVLIREIMSQYRFVPVPELPRFCGGLVGYLGYDLVRYFERLPGKPKDDLRLPDMVLILARDLVIFDHLNHTMKIVHCLSVDPKASLAAKKKLYQGAIKKIDALLSDINRPLKSKVRKTVNQPVRIKPRANVSPEGFEQMVRLAKEEILRGEIIQTVLSQRFEVDLKTDPFQLYRMLRALNPSPYMYFLNFDDIHIIGSSPELLVRCEEGVVETRPIAGTRPRGKNEEDDQRLMAELLADPKEKAEHIMLVDLGRNDLGRVCASGTVKVSEFMAVEKYSHVMHIVSNVRGQLAPGKDAFDVLQAAFPAGTVSGAPKIRAMEIIDRLENVSRGPYAGCIGYFSFSGNLDSCITIRTIVAAKGKAFIQAGAGIVADSDPRKEFEETVNKAKAQIKAIEKAYQQFL